MASLSRAPTPAALRASWGASSGPSYRPPLFLLLFARADSSPPACAPLSIGPAIAIPKALKLAGLTADDVDFFEINEAFASQAVYSVKALKLPFEKVNVHGGAIALGHPLGATGARQVATGLGIAKRTGGKVFVTSMCVGSGMGLAGVFVSEQ